jgi:Zn-dependent protease with chaperone function
MTLLLVAIGVALLAFPGLAERTSATAPPREWSRISASALLAGSIVIELGLVLTALPTILHIPAIANATGACHSIVDRINSGPLLGWGSLAVACVSLVAMAAAVRRSRRLVAAARVEPWLGDHLPRDEYEIVVVPTAKVLAMSVPGDRPQIVVSEAVVAQLDEKRLEAVIEHEAAHLRFRHRRYLLIAAAVDRGLGWLPGARRSANALRGAVEEWADNEAVGSSSSRQNDLRAALAAFAEGQSAPSAAHGVDARLLRLSPAWTPAALGGRLAGYSLALSLLVGGIAALTMWWGTSHHLVAFGGYCPH